MNFVSLMLILCLGSQAQDTTPEPPPTLCDAQSVLRLADNRDELANVAPESPIFTDFGAPWCSLCKIYSPTTRESALHYGFVYAHINWEQARDLVKACGITGAPTYVVFHNGRRVRTIGLPSWNNQGGSAPQIDAMIKRVAQDLKIYP